MLTPADPLPDLQAAIAALNSQRAVLGDAVVDAALAPMLQRLAAPDAPSGLMAPARRLRQVSILFLDVVNSTSLSQKLDPEQISEVMDGALARGAAIVREHRGRVLQYAGDNILAAFGAETAAEDDAERAVHCGLAMLELGRTLGAEVRATFGHTEINVRVGIHTGEALLGGGVGGDREGDGNIRGLAVNIAARMEQTAPVGALRVSGDTWALVRGSFDAELQAPLEVKGVAAPVNSWLVRGAKPRALQLPGRGIQGMETPLVGRQAELAFFNTLLQAMLTERQPLCLTLVADAGLGKSRLLREFQHLLSAHPASWWLMQARSQPASGLQPYSLLRDLVARRLEIAESDDADTARAKLLQGLAPWLTQTHDPAPELLGQLIGLDFSESAAVRGLGGDARLLRDRAVTALGLWLERLAASDGSPVVLLLDDLHWADDASLDALQLLLNSVTGPLLALLCTRPALLERLPGWGTDLPVHKQLCLQPLDTTQGQALTQSLLSRLSPVPAELSELIQRRAEGNPFYAEELVGMLLDQGVIRSGGVDERDSSAETVPNDPAVLGLDEPSQGEWHFHPERLNPQHLPSTLTGVLQARLDALEPKARHALQMASVIGPVFWDDALHALDAGGPEALPVLRRKSLVQPRPTSAFDDTLEEAFQHHLLHQVSYDTVLKTDKREAHARTAAWLTQRVGNRSDEYLGITAEHYAKAGVHALAVEWFMRAAKRAQDRYAYKASMQYLDQAEAQAALQATPIAPEQRASMLHCRVLLTDALALRVPQARANEELLALGAAHGERAWIANALQSQSLLAYRTGQLDVAETAGRRGADVAEDIDDAVDAALCRGNLAWMAIERRDFDSARAELAAASRWARLARQRLLKPDDGIYEVQLMLVEAELHAATGDEQARSQALARSVALAGTLSCPRLVCMCHSALATLALSHADGAVAAVHIDELERIASEFGFAHQVADARMCRAELHLQTGQWASAESEAQAGSAGHGAAKDVLKIVRCRQLQAEALWRSGQVPPALALWQDIEATLQQREDAVGALAVRLRLADALAASGLAQDVAAARQTVLAALPTLQERDAFDTTTFGLAARLAAWRVLHRAGDPAAAGVLARAVAELDDYLSRFTDPTVRQRVRDTVPWHRDVVEACALAQATI